MGCMCINGDIKDIFLIYINEKCIYIYKGIYGLGFRIHCLVLAAGYRM